MCGELKGTGDLAALEHVAHEYGFGADDATIEECLASVREVYRKLDRRAKVIRELPKDLCPENKVTPQLAARKSLGLHPEVLILDECQEAYSHPEHGKEFGRLATAIVKRGPALGIILLLATQRPDAASLPTGISANIGIRCCLRVMDQTANDMVLGTSSYKRGIRATEFATKDKGIGYLAGHSYAKVEQTFGRAAALIVLAIVLIAIVVWRVRRHRTQKAKEQSAPPEPQPVESAVQSGEDEDRNPAVD